MGKSIFEFHFMDNIIVVKVVMLEESLMQGIEEDLSSMEHVESRIKTTL